MSAEDVEAFEAAKGEALQIRWLTMMVERHQGAIEMVRTGKDDGEDKQATALATTIVDGQEEQVDQMRDPFAPGSARRAGHPERMTTRTPV